MLFEYIGSEAVTKEEYCFWNEENDELEHYTKSELARKEHKKHREDVLGERADD